MIDQTNLEVANCLNQNRNWQLWLAQQSITERLKDESAQGCGYQHRQDVCHIVSDVQPLNVTTVARIWTVLPLVSVHTHAAAAKMFCVGTTVFAKQAHNKLLVLTNFQEGANTFHCNALTKSNETILVYPGKRPHTALRPRDTRLDSASSLCKDLCKRSCARSPWQVLCRSCCAGSLCEAICARCPK